MEYEKTLKDLRARMQSLEVGKDPSIVSQGLVPQRTMAQENKGTEDILEQSRIWLQDLKTISEKARKLNLQSSGGFSQGFKETYKVRPKKRPDTPEEIAVKEAKIAPLVLRRGERPSDYAPDSYRDEPIPLDADVGKVLEAVAAVESRGSGDYEAIGPVVKKGIYKGERAYGRYQVMEGNIGPWSEEALGRRLTKDEFLKDTQAQDTIAAHRLQIAKDKFGTWEDAASVWFSGQPMEKSGNASDDYLSTPQYVNKFRRNFKRD